MLEQARALVCACVRIPSAICSLCCILYLLQPFCFSNVLNSSYANENEIVIFFPFRYSENLRFLTHQNKSIFSIVTFSMFLSAFLRNEKSAKIATWKLIWNNNWKWCAFSIALKSNASLKMSIDLALLKKWNELVHKCCWERVRASMTKYSHK